MRRENFCITLWTIHKDTKNESNSQPLSSLMKLCKCCELYTKIQKMKAIHNEKLSITPPVFAVNYTQRYKKWKQFTTTVNNLLRASGLWTIHKDTKNESNSQPTEIAIDLIVSCELYTKIQKMKAIHNFKKGTTPVALLWTIHKDTKNESNSQLVILPLLNAKSCELYTKIQKMKAIHN